MLWETKQRERKMKHSRGSDLPPVNGVKKVLMHAWVGVAGVRRVLCSLALPSASVFFPPKRHTLILINVYKHLFNNLSLEGESPENIPHKCLLFRRGNKQSLL